MSKITTLNEKAIAVHVPLDVSAEGNGYNTIYTGNGEYEFHSLPYSELPPIKTGLNVSERSILAKGNEMTEEQWKGIVEPEKTFGYPSFGQIPNGAYQWYGTAKKSGLSLLKSKSLEDKSILILIKQ